MSQILEKKCDVRVLLANSCQLLFLEMPTLPSETKPYFCSSCQRKKKQKGAQLIKSNAAQKVQENEIKSDVYALLKHGSRTSVKTT